MCFSPLSMMFAQIRSIIILTEFLFYHEDNSFADINTLSEFGELQPLCSNSELKAEFHLVIAWSFLWTVPFFDPERAQVTVRVVSQKFWLCLWRLQICRPRLPRLHFCRPLLQRCRTDFGEKGDIGRSVFLESASEKIQVQTWNMSSSSVHRPQ